MDPNAGKRNLVNKLDKERLLAKLEQETFKRITLSFYKYVIINDPYALRDDLFAKWTALNCLGRIYISQEGINAQMNVPEQYWDEFEAIYTLLNISKMYRLRLPSRIRRRVNLFSS